MKLNLALVVLIIVLFMSWQIIISLNDADEEDRHENKIPLLNEIGSQKGHW